jgi:hypothetical protein
VTQRLLPAAAPTLLERFDLIDSKALERGKDPDDHRA